MRNTFGDIKQYLKGISGLECNSTTLARYVNQAQMLLAPKGKWVDLVQRFRFCIDSSGCITWVRQIITIEAWWLCNIPGKIRNRWYESQENGPGLLGRSDALSSIPMIQRDSAAVFDQPNGVDKKIITYSDVTEASDAYIIFQGYDENWVWIRTEPLGEGTGWIDGEKISLATSPMISTKIFRYISAVIKSETNGIQRVYSYKIGSGAQSPLAIYEPDETRPWYSRSQVPGLECIGTETNCDGSVCEQRKVDVIAKLKLIPVKNDNDWMLISNVAAIKAGVQCILARERNQIDQAAAYEGEAVRALSEELREVQGTGQVPTIRVDGPQIWGAPRGIGAGPSVFYGI